MDEEAALEQLPDMYAAALRLRARGLRNDEIARKLELEPEAVPSLLRLAEAKLAAISGAREPGPEREPDEREVEAAEKSSGKGGGL